MENEDKTEKKEMLTPEQAEAAFLEGTGENKKTPAKEESETRRTGEPENKETPAEKKESETWRTGEPEKKETPAEKKEPLAKPTYEAIEKALNDTKAWAHTLAMENAEFKKRTAGQPKKEDPENQGTGEPEKKKTPETDEVPADIKEFLEDYPEARPAIEHFAQKLLKKELEGLGLGKVSTEVSELKDAIAQSSFQMQVISGLAGPEGKWIPGHPDALQVMGTKEFSDFWKAELEMNPAIANYTAKDAIEFLTRFKKQKARSAAQRHDRALGDKAKDLEDMAETPDPGTETRGGRKKKDEEKSKEELFDEGAK